MKHLIAVEDGADGDEVLYVSDLPERLRDYLGAAAEHLQRITPEQYAGMFAPILGTLARYSYVLDADRLYWLTELEPGLVIVAVDGSGELWATALRSPNPEFGGRTPLPEDLEQDWDEDDNPQYDLVFRAWDAQFEADYREWEGFVRAGQDIEEQFVTLGSLLDEVIEGRDLPKVSEGLAALEVWAGEGVRM